MTNMKSIKVKKTKGFTIRITAKMAADISEIKAKCAQHDIAINFTQAVEKALASEIKAVQKHIHKELDNDWELGQQNLKL